MSRKDKIYAALCSLMVVASIIMASGAPNKWN